MVAVDLLIRNVSIISSTDTLTATVAVNEGKIIAISQEEDAFCSDQVIDGKGRFLLPGAIDAHVHVMEKITRETWETATRAAAIGGVTTIIDHPIGKPHIFDRETFTSRLKEAQRGALVDFAFHGACRSDAPELVDELIKCGVTTFKAFTTGDWLGPHFDNFDIYKMVKIIGEKGGVLGLHAEDDAIIERLTEKMKKEGSTPIEFVKSRPKLAETVSVLAALQIAKNAGSPLHFFHVSSGDSVELIRNFQRQGVRVTAETHPQFLLFNDRVYKDDKLGRAAKMNPPIKTEQDRLELWNGIMNGTIQLLTTDHSPWHRDEKYLDNIWEVKPGFPGIETLLPLMLNEVRKRNLTLNTLVKVLSENPARIFGLKGKGRISVGYDSDMVLVDLNKTKVIREGEIESAAKITPFDGFEVCPPLMTFRRGELVAQDGHPLGNNGGQFLKREPEMKRVV